MNSPDNQSRFLFGFRVFVWVFWGISAFLLLIPDPEFFFGKLHVERFTRIDQKHTVLFAALAVLFELARRKSPFWCWAAFLLGYGLAIELIQPYTGRTFDMADFYDDTIGVVIGVPLGMTLKAALSRFCQEK